MGVVILDIVRILDTIFGLCVPLKQFRKTVTGFYISLQLQFSDHHSYFRQHFQMLLELKIDICCLYYRWQLTKSKTVDHKNTIRILLSDTDTALLRHGFLEQCPSSSAERELCFSKLT